MTEFEVQQRRKTFGLVVAVDSPDLDVDPGELLSLVGPAAAARQGPSEWSPGCSRPIGGPIMLERREVVHDPAYRGGTGADALFPNTMAADNNADGVVRKRSSRHGKRKVDELVELMGVGDAAHRAVRGRLIQASSSHVNVAPA